MAPTRDSTNAVPARRTLRGQRYFEILFLVVYSWFIFREGGCLFLVGMCAWWWVRRVCGGGGGGGGGWGGGGGGGGVGGCGGGGGGGGGGWGGGVVGGVGVGVWRGVFGEGRVWFF
jgi:hypothetical protein